MFFKFGEYQLNGDMVVSIQEHRGVATVELFTGRTITGPAGELPIDFREPGNFHEPNLVPANDPTE